MTLWGSRFKGQLDANAWNLNASLSFDQRLAPQDVRGSLAWARALEKAGVLTQAECSQICEGLETIAREFEQGRFEFGAGDEDIHTAVERRLGEIIGPLAGKLHTGRSRNDQVALDFRLWLLDHLEILEAALHQLQKTLVMRAEADMGVMMPGYTHLQRAQPILLSHWWLSHFWPLQRDLARLSGVKERTAWLPLGSGALAGTPYPIDRQALAAALGFTLPAPNSLDAVADRDFAAEFLFACALIGIHLSRLAEAVILYTSAEFGFFELSDAFATGSSLMPQKKNPDVFELARGKAGPLLGDLVSLMTTLKGLPSAYDKDLQEDKQPVFRAYDNLAALLPVLAGALETLTIHPERMRQAVDASMLATSLADALVRRGIPFRQAYSAVGKAVQLAATKGKPLSGLSLEEWEEASSIFAEQEIEEFAAIFDPRRRIEQYQSIGGTSEQAVRSQIQAAKKEMESWSGATSAGSSAMS